MWFFRAFIVDDEGAARAAIVGGAGDKGVDVLHVDHDDRLEALVQEKYRQNANAGSENRVRDWWHRAHASEMSGIG